MIKREIKIETTTKEEISIVRKYALKNPEVLKILTENPKGLCPFPDTCNQFPCRNLSCNADTCDNGYCFRWS